MDSERLLRHPEIRKVVDDAHAILPADGHPSFNLAIRLAIEDINVTCNDKDWQPVLEVQYASGIVQGALHAIALERGVAHV